MESQCAGLAEALGLIPVIKRVNLRAPWRQLTPYFRIGGMAQFASGSDPFTPPYPDLLIATGRHSIAAALLVKRLSRGKTRNVQLQNPVIAPSHFDLVVVPRHDGISGPNIVTTKGALHRITPEVLREGAAKLAPRVSHLARPYIGVLIGGTNAAYRLEREEMAELAGKLVAAAREISASLVITPSRRTGEENIRVLKDMIGDTPHFLWDAPGDNPYFGILGLADYLVVTADSVNMVSEAASAGKPVYVATLPGGSAKFDRFHRMMREEGYVREFSGSVAPYSYAPLDDMSAVAARVRALLQN
jgi:mitochondrial fission protein ELM1